MGVAGGLLWDECRLGEGGLAGEGVACLRGGLRKGGGGGLVLEAGGV